MFKYRDEETAKKILERIKAMDVDVRLMHICGTHQDTIVRFGLEEMLNDVGVRIAQGPGCPVCVTTSAEIADAITLARNGVTVTAFGDMMRVPTTIGSLFSAKADGADVRIVYSIDDAVQMARDQPDKPLVFVGVGFETTAPSTCVPLHKDDCPENFSVYSCHRICPPIIETLFSLGENRIDGFIMPGHVAVITGTGMFEPVSEIHHVPQVIAGFEPLDILMSCYMLCKQIKEGRAEVENEYTRLVRPEGPCMARIPGHPQERLGAQAPLRRPRCDEGPRGHPQEHPRGGGRGQGMQVRRCAERHHKVRAVPHVREGLQAHEPDGAVHGLRRRQLLDRVPSRSQEALTWAAKRRRSWPR